MDAFLWRGVLEHDHGLLQGSERGESNTTLVLSLRARTRAGLRW